MFSIVAKIKAHDQIDQFVYNISVSRVHWNFNSMLNLILGYHSLCLPLNALKYRLSCVTLTILIQFTSFSLSKCITLSFFAHSKVYNNKVGTCELYNNVSSSTTPRRGGGSGVKE